MPCLSDNFQNRVGQNSHKKRKKKLLRVAHLFFWTPQAGCGSWPMNRPMDRSPEWTGAQMALRISGRRREAQVGSSWGVEDLVPTSDLSGSEASSGPGARCLGRLRATSAGLDLGPKLVRNLSRCTAQTRRYRVRDSKSHQRVKESSTRTVVCSKMEVLDSCMHVPDILTACILVVCWRSCILVFILQTYC